MYFPAGKSRDGQVEGEESWVVKEGESGEIGRGKWGKKEKSGERKRIVGKGRGK